MNIFENYLEKIKRILLDLSKKNNLLLPKTLNGITTELPPSKFNSDISTNVAMILSKINKKSPMDLADVLVNEIKKKDQLIDNISIVKPGFINIKLKPIFWTNFIREIISLIKKSEFKRKQAPPILKLSSQSLGNDWRVPIAISY